MEVVDWAEMVLHTCPGLQSATVYSDSMLALQSIANPAHQSGQAIIRHIMRVLCRGQERGIPIRLVWILSH
jgi:hypothetical protein